jgi:hypothetical protein
MGQGRDRYTRTVALANVLTGLLVEHPIGQRKLRSVWQPDLDVVARHDVEPADDRDFFTKVRVESVIDFRRRRFMGSVAVVSRCPQPRTLLDSIPGNHWAGS